MLYRSSTTGSLQIVRERVYSAAYPIDKLEYLAVYGRASMAAFRQLSAHGQKFDRESLYEPMIWSQISILDPPPLTLDFLVRLVLNFNPMGELWGSVRPATYFLSRTDRNVTT